MHVTPAFRAAARAIAQARADEGTARRFRDHHADDVAHLGEADLLAAIGAARRVANQLGLRHTSLRMRFIMLDVFRMPGFWRDPSIWQVLTARTGTPEARFGDACAMLRLAAIRAGHGDMIWWQA